MFSAPVLNSSLMQKRLFSENVENIDSQAKMWVFETIVLPAREVLTRKKL